MESIAVYSVFDTFLIRDRRAKKKGEGRKVFAELGSRYSTFVPWRC